MFIIDISESGLIHEGCYLVMAGYGLYLLEGLSEDLTDNPFQREDAVMKCAITADKLDYSIIGVASGYCISGNNRLYDYTVTPSNNCKNGEGANINGAFYMDVYTIPDSASDNVVNDSTNNELQNNNANIVTLSITTLLIATLCILLL